MYGWLSIIVFTVVYDLIAKKSLTNLFYEFSRKHPFLMALLWGYLTAHLWLYAHIRKYDPLSRGRYLVKGEP